MAMHEVMIVLQNKNELNTNYYLLCIILMSFCSMGSKGEENIPTIPAVDSFNGVVIDSLTELSRNMVDMSKNLQDMRNDLKSLPASFAACLKPKGKVTKGKETNNNKVRIYNSTLN